MYTTSFVLLLSALVGCASSHGSGGGSKEDFSVPVMMVGGNFTLGGKPSNLAQYDPELRLWVDQFEPHLFVLGASAGSVRALATNRSESGLYDNLYVAGSFDTTCPTCQHQLCSVGKWARKSLDTLGQGLCSSHSDPTLDIAALVLGSGGDIFVGGSFETRVWNGSYFTMANHVARFIGGDQKRWLPLSSEGSLGCTNCLKATVTSLAWDPELAVLFIGGTFDTFVSGHGKVTRLRTPGLAYWRQASGRLHDFPSGSLGDTTPVDDEPTHPQEQDQDRPAAANSNTSTSLPTMTPATPPSPAPCTGGADSIGGCNGHNGSNTTASSAVSPSVSVPSVSVLSYDPTTQSLFVAGVFNTVVGSSSSSSDKCHGVARFTLMKKSAQRRRGAGGVRQTASQESERQRGRRTLSLLQQNASDQRRRRAGGSGESDEGAGSGGGGGGGGLVWSWECLATDPSHAFKRVTAMLYAPSCGTLFVAGQPTTTTTTTNGSGLVGESGSLWAETVDKDKKDKASKHPTHTIARYYFSTRPSTTAATATSATTTTTNAEQKKEQEEEPVRVWEWLPNFDGTNGDINSLFWIPKSPPPSSPQPPTAKTTTAPTKKTKNSPEDAGGKDAAAVGADGDDDDNGDDDGVAIAIRTLVARKLAQLASSLRPVGSSPRPPPSLPPPRLSLPSNPKQKPRARSLRFNPLHESKSKSKSSSSSSGYASSAVAVDEKGSLLIAGSFTNYPSVAIWVNPGEEAAVASSSSSSSSASSSSSSLCYTVAVLTDANPVVPGSGVGGITGTITSITPVLMNPKNSYSPKVLRYVSPKVIWLVVGGCVALGIILGILVAFTCHHHHHSHRLRLLSPSSASSSSSQAKQDEHGIALQTLSYGVVPDLDIVKSYDKAMRARHIPYQPDNPYRFLAPARHDESSAAGGHGRGARSQGGGLTLIDPSEIVLHHVIGEGSFGRVWSAQWQSSQVAVKEFVFAQAGSNSHHRHDNDDNSEDGDNNENGNDEDDEDDTLGSNTDCFGGYMGQRSSDGDGSDDDGRNDGSDGSGGAGVDSVGGGDSASGGNYGSELAGVSATLLEGGRFGSSGAADGTKKRQNQLKLKKKQKLKLKRRATTRREVIEEIVGEAGIMSCLRHPRILQLYGCSLTAQAIWIVAELCSVGSLRQVLDDKPQSHEGVGGNTPHHPPSPPRLGMDLPLVTRLQMAVDVAEGMAFLHSRDPPIIHRDLKSHNLFVQELAPSSLAASASPPPSPPLPPPSAAGLEGLPVEQQRSQPVGGQQGRGRLRRRFCVKIGDWGSARAMALSEGGCSGGGRGGGRGGGESSSSSSSGSGSSVSSGGGSGGAGGGAGTNLTRGVGTVCWLAPELILTGEGSERIDVYSFGVVLWEIATREEVHAHLSAVEVLNRVAYEGLRPTVPSQTQGGCPWGNVMQACWHQDPAARPGFDQVLLALRSLLQRAVALEHQQEQQQQHHHQRQLQQQLEQDTQERPTQHGRGRRPSSSVGAPGASLKKQQTLRTPHLQQYQQDLQRRQQVAAAEAVEHAGEEEEQQQRRLERSESHPPLLARISSSSSSSRSTRGTGSSSSRDTGSGRETKKGEGSKEHSPVLKGEGTSYGATN